MAAASKSLFARHTTLWAQQSARAQAQWSQRARQGAKGKRQEIEAYMEKLIAQLELLHDRRDAIDDHVPPLCMSSAAMTPKLLDMFERTMSAKTFRNAATIKAHRDAAFACPLPWDNAYLGRLGKHFVWTWEEPVLPTWGQRIGPRPRFLPRVRPHC